MRPEHTTIMELPEELHSEIFLWLPAPSLLICKCVCKSFLSIIEEPYFTRTHVTRTGATSYRNSQTLILQFQDTKKSYDYGFDYCLLSVDTTTKDVLSCEPVIPPVPHIGEFLIIGSCNGLICAYLHAHDHNDDMILLWNPVTRQTRYLSTQPKSVSELFPIYEFGFIPENNDYMVVRMTSDLDGRIQIDLYKMSTESWTTIDCSSFVGADLVLDRDVYQFDTPVFSNGSFHWGSETGYIVSFNLKDEELGLIKVPNHIDAASRALKQTAALEKSLALMYRRLGDEKLEIRVMTISDVQEHGRLPCLVNEIDCVFSATYIDGYLMIDKPGKKMYLYDLKTGKRKKVHTSKTWKLFAFCNFVETLTPVRYVAE